MTYSCHILSDILVSINKKRFIYIPSVECVSVIDT